MTSPTAYVFGKGGHAHVIASLLPHARVVFLVDQDQADFFAAPPRSDCDVFIGIGDNVARRAYFDRLEAAGLVPANCIAPTAWVAASAQLGKGVFLGPGAVVGARSRVGDNIVVNTLSSIDHDCIVGDDTQLAPGVTLGSHLRIGRGCFFGMKSCVVPRLEIGDGATIMAGALVVRSAPAGVLLGGSPARIMRDEGTAGPAT